MKHQGIFIHAIDMYLEETPRNYALERFEIYKAWVKDNLQTIPIEAVYDGSLKFCPDMASNPDNILYGWNSLVPSLMKHRGVAQNVSLMVGGIKR